MLSRTIEKRLEQIEREVHEIKTLLIRHITIADKLPQIKEEVFMNVKDIANLAKIESATVYSACMKKEIKFIRIGRSYKFKREDVLKWLNYEKETHAFKAVNVDDYVDKYLQKHILKG